MISEGSCDTEDWTNGYWKIQAYHLKNQFIFLHIKIHLQL